MSASIRSNLVRSRFHRHGSVELIWQGNIQDTAVASFRLMPRIATLSPTWPATSSACTAGGSPAVGRRRRFNHEVSFATDIQPMFRPVDDCDTNVTLQDCVSKPGGVESICEIPTQSIYAKPTERSLGRLFCQAALYSRSFAGQRFLAVARSPHHERPDPAFSTLASVAGNQHHPGWFGHRHRPRTDEP
jgi:hypothetical protein